MAEDPDTILLEAEEAMDKAVDYARSEMKGVRTGRASPGLIEYVKVEAYGAESDLRTLAMIQAPEPTQLVVKPFDPSTIKDIIKGIEASGLGLNPMPDGKIVRINIPALSGDRRKQLVASVKQMGEQAKITIRNARRDANKALDQAGKDKSLGLSEDEVKDAKEQIDELTKTHEAKVEESVTTKSAEIEAV
ncbi:MAG: ribosome recycling factor [Planctomycetota bacterium]